MQVKMTHEISKEPVYVRESKVKEYEDNGWVAHYPELPKKAKTKQTKTEVKSNG